MRIFRPLPRLAGATDIDATLGTRVAALMRRFCKSREPAERSPPPSRPRTPSEHSDSANLG
jgi:hypothetical protein